MPILIDEKECVGCAVCVDECPNGAITMEDEIAKVDPEKCDECGTCVESCPVEAIKLEKSKSK